MTGGISALGSSLGKVASGGLKIFTAGVGAAATGITALSTAAINGYADYEQLVGGVETLFDNSEEMTILQGHLMGIGYSAEEAAKKIAAMDDPVDTVMNNAANAYKTAGLSANEYMETVTSFSASLIQSLGGDTVAAAKYADMAITDMSDNANKMGSSMESIQNAYQGFAKQNYTMLDNLKLGYGGTKEEMQRLLADATAISGVEYDLSSYADVVDAIHVIQTEMDITGTTAKEASSTISGSVSMMKAAWSNLVVGVADDSQDFDVLIDNFVESVETVAQNILPRVETTLLGVGNLVESLLPVIIDRVPEIVNNILPQLLQSGMNMITVLLNGIQQNLPEIAQGALSIISQLVTTFIQMLPQIIELGLQVIIQLALGIAQALPELIPQIVDVVLTIIQTLIDNIDLLVDAAIQLMTGFALGIIQALPLIIEKAPEIIVSFVTALIENAPKLLEAALEIITMLIDGIVDYSIKLIGVASQVIADLKNYFINAITNIDFGSIGQNIIDGIWNGLSSGWSWLKDKVSGLANELYESAKEALGIHSPSTKFKYLADMCIAGFDGEMDKLFNPDSVTRTINASLSTVRSGISGNGSSGTTYGDFNQTIVVNDKVSTPDELARAVRLESRYGLMKGVVYG